ncbi:MAG: hypothetical protein JWQ00_941 [Noviherbaspirillum sp.]|jgi:hypothetical protein|nr:hypothetical protein [Noviherbaspirillum sp.]
MKRLLAIVVLLFGWAAHGAAAAVESVGHITSDDAVAIRAVVQSQLNALADDDANAAFELTTPTKRTLFSSAEEFLRMVKEQYTPIYRPQLALFSSPQVVDGNAVQVVRVTDDERHVWIAIFWMERGDDTNWKIDGCQLFRTSSISI